MILKLFAGVAAAALMSSAAFAAERQLSADEAKAFEIFQKIIAMRTAEEQGNVPKMASYLSSELRKGGFSKSDIKILPVGETAGMIVRYKGDGSSGKKPIVFLAHMDVVDARPEDWELNPFVVTEKDGYFFGRGVADNKYGVMNLTQTFIRLKKSGYVPNRDLVIAFTGDEETNQDTTKLLARELADAEFALNTDAGGGVLGPDGKPLVYAVQAAEKTYATFEITAKNQGGHSSRPRTDNAIYDLADAIENVRKLDFPVMSNAITLKSFAVSGAGLGGELGDALVKFAKNPKDKKAAARIAAEPSFAGMIKTTCVTTMLRGGHAENALPQTATATVNCRVFPGTAVDDVKNALTKAIANDALEVAVLREPNASPISEPRDDVMAAVAKAVHARYPGLPLVPYLEMGGTDGKEFRIAGVPTWAVSGMFMKESDMFAHGLNERIPVDAFFGGLDHWTIIIKELAGGAGSTEAAASE